MSSGLADPMKGNGTGDKEGGSVVSYKSSCWSKPGVRSSKAMTVATDTDTEGLQPTSRANTMSATIDST